jgi:cytochrome c553
MLRSWLPILPTLALAGCSVADAGPGHFTANGKVIAMGGGDGGVTHACFSCHGLDGGGDNALVPRLAGLDPGYLHRQLDDYASGRRAHDAMRTIARRLSPVARARVSAYYAGLAFAAAPSAPADATGARLYDQGDPSRGLASCASCHGREGEGVGPGNPPLAGQSVAYVAAQIEAWRGGRRQNDPMGEMGAVSRLLTPHEMRAVARHAASLGGGADPRAIPATSLQARRGDRHNDASTPRRHEAAPGSAAR